VIEPFDRTKWEETFREEIEPLLAVILRFHGQAAIDDLVGLAPGLEDMVFMDTASDVALFLRQRSQRFAERVNETTWNALKGALEEGMDAGEGIPALEARVQDIMGDRIRSSAETIARTETVGASNGGILRAWEQSDVVQAKVWVSALIPGRTREDHEDAHGQTVPVDADFLVGGAMGPHPGEMRNPKQDINCLCTMEPVLKDEFRAGGTPAIRALEGLSAIFWR